VCVYIYIYICRNFKKRLCQHYKINALITQFALQRCTKHRTYIFENELCPTIAFQQRQHLVAVGYRMFLSGMIGRFVFVILRIDSGCIQTCAHTAPLCLPACPDQAYKGTLYVTDLAQNQIKYFISYVHISSCFDISATSDWVLMCSYSVMILHFRLLRIAKETLIIAAACCAKFCSLSRSGTFGFANH